MIMARGNLLKTVGSLGSAGMSYLESLANDPKKAGEVMTTAGELAGLSTGKPPSAKSVRDLAEKQGIKIAGEFLRNEGGMRDNVVGTIGRAGQKISSDLQSDNEPAISAARAAARSSVPVAEASDIYGNPDAPRLRKRPDPDHFNAGFDEAMKDQAMKRQGSNNGGSD